MTSGLTVLEIARPECAEENLADEVVALNVETGIYFSLRGLAVALWNDLAAGHPVQTLADRVRAAGLDAASVTDFATRLTDHGLMRPSAAAPAAGEPTTAAQLTTGQREIVFEVYEDMQDLILSDPIHDVDETVGWPGVRSPGA